MATAHREVAALPPVQAVARGRHVDPGERGDRVRVETRGVHDPLARQQLRAVRRPHLEPVKGVAPLDPDELGARLEHRTVASRVVEQRVHQAVGAHDPGRGRDEPRHRGHGRLELLARLGAHELELDAVRFAERAQPLELLRLPRLQRDDQLADPAMRHSRPLAKLVQQVLAAHAQARLERARRVVHPGVDHLAVAARGLAAVPLVTLQDHEIGEAPGEPRRDREAHDARADHRDGGVRHARGS